ncbi:MAG: magnesium/cobalt transporter CorA [Dehalococcoidia bacterium]
MATDYQEGVRALLCTEHGMAQPRLRPDEIDSFITDPRNLLWLDVDLSVAKDLSLLRQEFGFHELTLEDAVRPHQRPKIDPYGTYSFLIFYAVTVERLKDGEAEAPPPPNGRAPGMQIGSGPIHAHQVAIFVGANYLVTVHNGALAEIEEIAARWHENIGKIERSIGTLLYSLLDTIVDDYFPVVDQIADIVEDIEEGVFERFRPEVLEDIFTLKKSLLAMRKVVAPERDVANVLIRRDLPLFGAESIIYFQDLYDHLVRVTDSIDIYRDLLNSALDGYMSMSSNRLNDVMKTLTSWSIPLMAGAFLAGVWGMNFEHQPEFTWRYGYLFAWGTIITVFVVIWIYFRRKRWL